MNTLNTLNILYLGTFDKPYRTEVWVAKSLSKLGHSVSFAYEGVSGNEEIIAKLKKADVFLYSKANTIQPLSDILEYCRGKNIISVCWLYDLYWGTPREHETRHDRFKADIVLTTDGGHQREWQSVGVDNRVLRQGIFQDEAFIGNKKDIPEEIVFVANKNAWHPKREELDAFLRNNYGSKYKRYGDENQIRGKDLNDLFASVKIVVGDNYPSPNYWSNRVYETLGRGGFLVTPRVSGLEKEFRYYKHFIPFEYGNYEQLKEIIDYYLTHDKEREKIRMAGHRYCKENYTYLKRCEELCGILKEEMIARKKNPAGKDIVVSPDNLKKDDGGITTILLNYKRPEQVKRLIKELKRQKGVKQEIWVWDSSGKDNNFGCATFKDPINTGVESRWELARMARTKYVVMLDDDVHLMDDYVIKDLLEAKKKEPPQVILGWRGVRQFVDGQKYTDCYHTRSELSKKDQFVHIIKGQIFIIDREHLERSRSFPQEIKNIDDRTHGEIFYGLYWGNNQPIHKVLACLSGRVKNIIGDGKGLEHRKDHKKKQNEYWDYCINRKYIKNV